MDFSAIPDGPLVAVILVVINVLLLSVGLREWHKWRKQQRT